MPGGSLHGFQSPFHASFYILFHVLTNNDKLTLMAKSFSCFSLWFWLQGQIERLRNALPTLSSIFTQQIGQNSNHSASPWPQEHEPATTGMLHNSGGIVRIESGNTVNFGLFHDTWQKIVTEEPVDKSSSRNTPPTNKTIIPTCGNVVKPQNYGIALSKRSLGFLAHFLKKYFLTVIPVIPTA